MLTDKTLAKIVHRIFIEHQSTLLEESTQFQANELANTCFALRSQMLPWLEKLPKLAFEPDPDRQSGEAGWSAGEVVSHNNDRLLWALSEAAITTDANDNKFPQPPKIIVSNCARDPQPLDRDLAIQVLLTANGYFKTVLPLLLSADNEQTTEGTHHGLMSLRSWLLLICIHDSDHLEQLCKKHTSSSSGQQ